MDVAWANHRGGRFRFRSFDARGLPHDVRWQLGTRRFPATLTAPGRAGRTMAYAGVVLDVPTVARYETPDDGHWLVKAAFWRPLASESGGLGLIAYREGQDGGFDPDPAFPPFVPEGSYEVFEWDGEALSVVRGAART